jgi:serine/threonine protein phosphatase 1
VPEYGHHSAPEADPVASASPLVYAIGDIHGSLQKLCDLIGRCERHADGRPAAFVFLGDYIDRGPDSAAVIDTVMNLQLRLKHRVIARKS